MQQEHRQAKPSRAGPGTGRAALAAAAVMLALTIWGRGPALALAGALVGPLPALRTALEWGRQAAGEAPAADSAGEAPASSTAPALDSTAIERYLVPLLTDADKPADAGAVAETSYGQGSGEKYIACAAGTIKNNTSVSAAEVAAEVQNPLPFAIELNSPEPQVLIMHTHATESYEAYNAAVYDTRNSWRTTDNNENMVAVGDALADALTAAGIGVVHDTQQFDYPSYNGSYDRAAEVIRQYQARYPDLQLILDVHRDGIQRDASTIVKPVTEIDGEAAAQIMILCGSDSSIPDWGENLRTAAAVTNLLETRYPSLMRPIFFSTGRYNMDLSGHLLLLEFGSQANTLEEALTSARLTGAALADWLKELAAR